MAMEQSRSTKRPKKNYRPTNPTNLTLNSNPLLNSLVLENVFEHFRGQNSMSLLVNYRIVCRAWDEEITKLMRKYTQINLTEILEPYPEGMGWTASGKKSQAPFHYKAPYQQVCSFENISVDGKWCSELKCVKWIKWFQLIGSQVKRLQFSSYFTCLCQNQFFERILKEWCPNLEYLEIRGVKSVDSLLLMSSFKQKSVNFIFKKLKGLRVSLDGAEERFSLCVDKYTTSNIWYVEDMTARKMCMQMSNEKLVNFIYKYGRGDSGNEMTFPQIVNMKGKKVSLPVRLIENQDLPDLSEYFSDHLKPTDGGIVGQIMKEVQVGKFEIHGLNELNQCQDLVSLFHVRPNKWRSSLKDLELGELLSKSVNLLHVIAQLKFPLTRIQLGGVHSNEDEEMTRFLSCFEDTLECLEFSGSSFHDEFRKESSQLIIPFLPKLKTFVHENIIASCLSAENLWRNAPNLERCRVTGTLNKNVQHFFENSEAISSIFMKELKLATQITGRQGEMILNWFPNLIKLEVSLESLGTDAYGFFEKLGNSKVDKLKIDILGYANQDANSNTAVFWKTGDIEGLKSIELKNMTGLRLRLSPQLFSKGNLATLKLNNFRILKDDKKKLLSSLSHIPSIQLVDGVFIPRFIKKEYIP